MPFFVVQTRKILTLTATARPRTAVLTLEAEANPRHVLSLEASPRARFILTLSGTAKPRYLLDLGAEAEPRHVVSLTATAEKQRKTLRLVGTARAPERRYLTLTATAVGIPTRRVLRLVGKAQGSGKTVVRSGVGESWKITVSALLGEQYIKSWSYNRPDGLNPSLQVVFRGDMRSSASSKQRITIKAENAATGQVLAFSTESLTGNGVYDYRSGKFSETTLNFASQVPIKLGQVLPALVPWELDPPEELDINLSCEQQRAIAQRMTVRSLIRAVLNTTGLKAKFLPGGYQDLFDGDIVQDTAADYSTKGKTALQVLQDFYGRAGAVIASENDDTVLIMHPEFSQASLADLADVMRYRTGSSETSPAGQPLGYLHLTGLPEEMSFLEAFGNLPDAPDQAAVQFELGQNVIDTHVQTTVDGRVYQGTQKVGGFVTREGSITLGDVTVKAPEGITPAEKTFYRVPKSVSNTYHFYSDTCAGQLLMSYTENKSWGYSYNTSLSSVTLSIPGYTFGISGGDPLGTETTQVNSEWSEQGWLKRRFTVTRKTGSMAIENAGEENEQLLEGLTIRQTTEERWLPIGGGRWRYTRIASGDQLTPVTDDAGAWVDIQKKSGVIESITEETDNAPDTASCRCDDVLVPHEYEWNDPDGTESVEESFPTETDLEPLAESIIASRKIRKIRQTSVGLPLPVRYRDLLNGGIVTGISASGNGGAGFSLTITTEEVPL
ncbi:hypothetical protein [Deinococcus cellulosilyticus]|uniref:Uncharacterized protein n=1 Tax=Deinococcus cellulosilyticus (strain DSM 18568 / NBRC 106333 / KACC 11606 / 5516J-15) TaxID=1223518 RepID=A0A511MZE0_DEIC1|nr:hypothetical protein [Deinococcus cellulosilyticus]GEM45919.1 hypothetical protein DC3_15540 [Deinococcus cellulosilyticus NBRC 106333 = KACC 11606]